MLGYIAEILLKSRIKKNEARRYKKFLPWDKIGKIGLIISGHYQVSKKAIDKFAEETQKFIEVFYVELNSHQASYADWQCYSKKDSSILKLPKKERLEELKNRNFDVVINAGNDHDLFSAALTSELKATLKCGSSARFNNVDLIVLKDEPFQLEKYLQNIVKYLKVLI